MLTSSTLYQRACRFRVFALIIVNCLLCVESINAAGQVRQLPAFPLLSQDSIPAVASVKDSIIRTASGVVTETSKRSVSALSNAVRSPLSGVKQRIKQAVSLPSIEKPSMKEILASHKLAVTQETQVDRTYWGTGYYMLNRLILEGSIQVAKIPLAVRFLHQNYSYPSISYTNNFQVTFDKDAFLDNYRKQLAGKIKIDKEIPKDKLLQLARQAAEKTVSRTLDSMKQDFMTGFQQRLPGLDTIRDFSTRNVGGVFQSIIGNDYSNKIAEKQRYLKQLETNLSSGTLDARDTAMIPGLKKEIAMFYKLLSYYKKYQALQKQMNLVDLENRLNSEEAARAQQLSRMLNDPSSLQQLAADRLPLSGLEKVFLYVNSMNMGQHTITLSPLSLNAYLTNGVSMEFFKENKYLFLLVGKERDIPAVYDRPYFSMMRPNDHIASGIRVGRGALKEDHIHLSIFNFRQSKVPHPEGTFDMPSKSSMVMGLSNRFRINETSVVSLELSKSSAVLTDALYGNDTVGNKRSALAGLADMKNFGQSVAVIASYSGEFTKQALNVEANVSKVASAYYNPGAAFMPGGTTEGALSLRKSFMKNKLVINARGNWREYAYSTMPSSRWRNNNYLLETRIRLTNSQQLSFRYQPVRGVHITPAYRRNNNITDRITGEFSFQKRLRNTFYRNTISLTYNRSRYLWAGDSTANLKAATITSMQSVTIGQQLLYGNVTYTYSQNPGGPAYLNSLLNTDVGITYMLGKKISATSGLNYSNMQRFYEQAGFRQSLSANLNSHLATSLFVDCRFNIKQYETYYDDLVRVDWSIKYNF